MKKFKYLLLVLTLMFLIPCGVSAKVEKPKLYLFHLTGCPHCAQAREYINSTILKEYPDVEFIQYEVGHNADNNAFLDKIQSVNGVYSSSVPYIMIGEYVLKGWNSDSKNVLHDAVDTYINGSVVLDVPELVKNGTLNSNNYNSYIEDCHKRVSEVIPEDDKPLEDKKENNNNIKELPIIGKVDVTKFSLPIIATVIGFIDGFNPCAMWILLFLISMLLGTGDKKRMWILGLAFLFASAFVYLLFMVLWLNVAIKMNQVIWIRTLIAIFALVAGTINLKSFFFPKKDSGCEVVNDNKRKKIFNKIKTFTKEKSIWLALIGVITLACSVNIIELACSAGLPLLFTQILALNNLSKAAYMVYILIYIFFFLIDDIIVFLIAMVTLHVTGITTKYSKYSHLIGGVIMVLIGILLIFKPEILMLGM